jgi:uncharacterized membrane protein (UPF0127 family)
MNAAPLQFHNVTRGTTLADQAKRADNPWTRFVGLLGRKGLGQGEGLHIVPCTSVHTWFMRFTIDVLYVDREGTVVKAVQRMKPFRYSWGGRRAHSVVELPAGTIAATGTAVGDRLTLHAAPLAPAAAITS